MSRLKVLNVKFCEGFLVTEEGDESPHELYMRTEDSESGRADKRVRKRLVGLIYKTERRACGFCYQIPNIRRKLHFDFSFVRLLPER